MVKIPAGTFLMGSPEDEKGRHGDEGPQHAVTISHDFALGRYPVTFEEYDHFCESADWDKPKDEGWGRGRHPVIYISYRDAEAYCAWLSCVTEVYYRLPTEAEWEYACRAGTTNAFAFGDAISDKQANFGQNVGKTTEVGDYSANGWNLYDMHGNVFELCADHWHDTYVNAPTDGSAWCADDGARRVRRGGSWDESTSQHLRSASRFWVNPSGRSATIGFRCARVQVSTDQQSKRAKDKRGVWTIDSGKR